MLNAVKASWALFTGLGLLMLGNGLQAALLGVRASIEGFGTLETGFIMSCFYVGFFGGSLIVPRVVHRVGHVRTFGALASVASTAVLLHAVYLDPWVWSVLRFISGFSFAGLYIVAESWLNDAATNKTRGQLLAFYMIVVWAGIGGGYMLLNAGKPSSFELFTLISIMISLALVPILISVNPAPVFEAPESMGLKKLFKVSPLGIVGTFFVAMSQGTVLSMGFVYASRINMSVSDISLFMTAIIGGGLLFQWPIGRLSDRVDRRIVITVITFAAALAALSVNLTIGMPVWASMGAGALFGALAMPMYSLCLAYTNDYLNPKQMVSASASLVLVGALGSSSGPSIGAALMELVGPRGLFWFTAGVQTAIGIFALYRMTQRPTIPVEDQGNFVAVAGVASQTQVAATLNPEAEWVEPEGEPAGPPPDETAADGETAAEPREDDAAQ